MRASRDRAQTGSPRMSRQTHRSTTSNFARCYPTSAPAAWARFSSLATCVAPTVHLLSKLNCHAACSLSIGTCSVAEDEESQVVSSELRQQRNLRICSRLNTQVPMKTSYFSCLLCKKALWVSSHTSCADGCMSKDRLKISSLRQAVCRRGLTSCQAGIAKAQDVSSNVQGQCIVR